MFLKEALFEQNEVFLELWLLTSRGAYTLVGVLILNCYLVWDAYIEEMWLLIHNCAFI